jgi:diguanylate cyclase (GGDEF)-like protein
LVSRALLNQHLFAWTKIPQLALLTFVCSGATLFIRALRLHSPVENGFFWTLLATFLALQFGGTGRIPTAYMATAGLALVGALIESSYFMAYHDELTSLPGRRAFNEAVLALEDRYALAILDIDHFKRFNDAYGHDTGDQVLRMVASRLARLTGGGKAFRWGGEEFAIVFPDKSTNEIIEDLELLRATIENSSFRMRGLDRRNQPRQTDRRKPVNPRRKISRSLRSTPSSREIRELSVTVSIGVAEAGTRNRDVEQVIEAADQALYRAKAAGRNRVEVASTPRARTSRSVKQSA